MGNPLSAIHQQLGQFFHSGLMLVAIQQLLVKEVQQFSDVMRKCSMGIVWLLIIEDGFFLQQ